MAVEGPAQELLGHQIHAAVEISTCSIRIPLREKMLGLYGVTTSSSTAATSSGLNQKSRPDLLEVMVVHRSELQGQCKECGPVVFRLFGQQLDEVSPILSSGERTANSEFGEDHRTGRQALEEQIQEHIQQTWKSAIMYCMGENTHICQAPVFAHR